MEVALASSTIGLRVVVAPWKERVEPGKKGVAVRWTGPGSDRVEGNVLSVAGVVVAGWLTFGTGRLSAPTIDLPGITYGFGVLVDG